MILLKHAIFTVIFSSSLPDRPVEEDPGHNFASSLVMEPEDDGDNGYYLDMEGIMRLQSAESDYDDELKDILELQS